MNRRQAKPSTTSDKPRFKAHVKRGDTVYILSGKDKGKTGVVRQVLLDRQKVVVEGLNLVTKAVKGNPMLGSQGGLIKIEAPLHLSKVMYYDLATNQPSRLGKKRLEVNGRLRYQRTVKKTGELAEA